MDPFSFVFGSGREAPDVERFIVNLTVEHAQDVCIAEAALLDHVT